MLVEQIYLHSNMELLLPNEESLNVISFATFTFQYGATSTSYISDIAGSGF